LIPFREGIFVFLYAAPPTCRILTTPVFGLLLPFDFLINTVLLQLNLFREDLIAARRRNGFFTNHAPE
jgi:hypothetical protein